jgi:DNA-binding XRE family transcriptional regulator
VTGERPLDILLRSARFEARTSQAELAARAGVTRQAISAVETGNAVPTSVADHLSIQAPLDTLGSPLFRLEIEALGQYDISALGREVSAA